MSFFKNGLRMKNTDERLHKNESISCIKQTISLVGEQDTFMRRALRILLLIVIFIAAVVVFFFIFNKGAETENMLEEKAGLPVVYMQQDGQWINELHGYRTEMSEVSMRDTILQMPEDDTLRLLIDTDEEVKSVSYEIITLDGSSEVAKGKGDISEAEAGYEASISLTDNLAQGVDNILVLCLNAGGEDVYYYSRLASFSDAHVSECMAFVKELHTITRDATRSNELMGKMEPIGTGAGGGLSRVTINSTLDQICWADFACEELQEPKISIKEITNSYSVYVLDYPVVRRAETDEYYTVREYYRVRYSKEKMYLLDFERTISRICSGDLEVGTDSINLGIREDAVDYATNETGSVISFVQEGDLWSFDTASGEMIRVFSFRDSEKEMQDAILNAQQNYAEHEIRTIRVDENGSIDFIVYGYMNSGWHAGEVGISVCHYDSVGHGVSELLFLPQNESYQQLKENVGSLMYLSDAGKFYFSVGTSVHQINLDSGKDTVLFDQVQTNFQISDRGRYFAWTDLLAGSRAEVMHVTDLETETTTDLPAGADKYIQPVGFLGTDLLYGTAYATDVEKGAQQNIFPMDMINIVDAANPNTVLKTYEGEGAYFSSVQISSEGSVTMERVTDKGTAYVLSDPLSIKNNDLLREGKTSVVYLDSQDKQVEIGLSLTDTVEEKPAVTIASLYASADAVVTELPEDLFRSSYYIYAKGKVIQGTENAARAVRLADEHAGVVVDADQRYVWNRAKMLIQNKIELQQAGGSSATAQALNVMLAAMGAQAMDVDAELASGKQPFEILDSAKGDGLLLNLSGCTLDEILYYIGRGYPAYAVGTDGIPVLVFGYDSAKVKIYQPSDDTTVEMSIQEASDLFAAEGNIFFVYQKQI